MHAASPQTTCTYIKGCFPGISLYPGPSIHHTTHNAVCSRRNHSGQHPRRQVWAAGRGQPSFRLQLIVLYFGHINIRLQRTSGWWSTSCKSWCQPRQVRKRPLVYLITIFRWPYFPAHPSDLRVTLEGVWEIDCLTGVLWNPASWQKAWETGITPWDKLKIQPALQELLDDFGSEWGLETVKNGTALVPGCGRVCHVSHHILG